ncbi:MAG: hypothetical protein JW732_06165 [Dehalococcoidia bacterium]|nr:hypothetical protein [Dehalococcoidia bacterium]
MGTLGSGAMDLYSQKLAERLDVPEFYTGIYQQIRERFNISWLSIKALRAIPEDWSFERTLSKLDRIVHLPNQHLGRYGNFLKVSYIITMYYLGIPDEQITVIYPGVDHAIFRPLPHSSNFEYPYILFVGSEHPRKNLPTLLKAFKKLKKQTQFKDLKMVKIGKAGGSEANYRGQTMQVINSL